MKILDMKVVNREVITNYEIHNVMGDLKKLIIQKNFPLPLKVKVTELVKDDSEKYKSTILDVCVKDSIGWPIRESSIINAVCHHLNIDPI